MSGNTGRLTHRGIITRGPRMKLARVMAVPVAGKEPTQIGMVIFREDQRPFRLPHCVWGWYETLASSYSLSYLKGIAKNSIL